MRNWRALLQRIARWLRPDGRLFLHLFTHRRYCDVYDVRDASDWMAEHFFTGGIMPSDDLIYEFADLVAVREHRRESGRHYQKTADAWLANLDARGDEVRKVLARTYGPAPAARWKRRWRVFFMACAELWGWNGGEDWIVSQYLLSKRS